MDEKILNELVSILHMLMTFDKSNCFCISLAGSSRRQRMMDRLRSISLECSMWNASTPSDLVDSFCGGLSVYQQACAQSHIHIWRHILRCELPYAMVLEDDAMFHKKWRKSLLEIEPQLIADGEWDCVFLNASEPVVPLDEWVVVREQYLTGGYVISNKGAKYLLERFLLERFCASDWMTSRLQERGHCYGRFPWLIVQEGRDTMIGSNLDADHAKVVRCLGEVGLTIEGSYF